jgi:hypothetical protein
VVFAVHGEAARRAFEARVAALSDPLRGRAGGGRRAPRLGRRHGALRDLLLAALRHGREELRDRGPATATRWRSPLRPGRAGCWPPLPPPPRLRADPEQAPERAWLLVAATWPRLVDLAAPARPRARDLAPRRGRARRSFLVLASRAPARPGTLDELVPLAFEDHAAGLDRLRAAALAVPRRVLGDVAAARADRRRPPRCGSPRRSRGSAAARRTTASVEEHEERSTACSIRGARPTARTRTRPGRRVARRILQRLDGMGKWGGYHTDFAHLARGFAGNERRSRRPSARRCSPRGCSRRSRRWASGTCSSTRAGRRTSAR